MTSAFPQTTPDDVVGKVLRRGEVAKMARKLQDRLALASYKAQHGQESLSFNDVEARLEKTIRQKRPSSSIGTSSTSSLSSSDYPFFSRGLASSPGTVSFPSDNIRSSGIKASRKRNAHHTVTFDPRTSSSKRVRSQSTMPLLHENSRASWKSSHNLPESSPIYRHRDIHYTTSHNPSASFASDVSTVPGSPLLGHVSDDDENHDLATDSFCINPAFNGSPPRTPPPTRSRAIRQRKVGGEEGADLLLYLATSPSPANPGARSSRVFAPSTPPSKNQALPSSMMNTPGMTGFSTPGQQFNFADFVNVTPSPAQGAFGNRTPGLPKTPLAAKEARRRLNFDALIPPGGSPNLSNVGRGSGKESGLGMELGGELVSRH